jgi:tetratricopeptide (TPR) repeat protein
VLNAKGDVVAVASVLLQGGQSLNFAIPSHAARSLITKADKAQAVKPLGTELTGKDDVIFADPDWRAFVAAEATGNYVEQLKHNQALVRRYPNNAVAQYSLGLTYLNLNFYEDAQTAFREAIKIRPDDPYSWYGLGFALAAKAKIEEATYAFRQAIKLKPEYADAWSALGNCYVDTRIRGG